MGDLIHLRDYQSKRQREQAEAALREMTLEQQAVEIMNVAIMGAPGIGMEPAVYVAVPYGGQGIDGMDFDAACSEMNPDQSA
jgi:hypothetical protein